MGLTGLEIFKHLPKTNCKECGFPTCLAFAMALAGGKTSLDQCPDVSEEAKEALASAAAPPIRKVKMGAGEKEVEMGDETELFRHDKRFENPTVIAIKVKDNEDIDAKLNNINDLYFERVGQEFEVEAVALLNESGEASTFKSAAEKVAGGTDKNVVLISEDPAAMEGALEVLADRKPLVYAATKDNYEKMTELAQSKGCPLGVKGDNLNDLAELVNKVLEKGYRELVIDSGSRDTSQVLADLNQIRRQAIKKKFRPFGFPTIAFASKDDPQEELIQGGVYLSKYASMLVLETDKKEHLLPLVSWRFNLFTDPQKPVQVEAGLHKVGEPKENSPVYCTTNFSLTYFLVEGEVDASRIPAYILCVDTGGTSVLTAYADNRFTAEKIAEGIKATGLEEKVNHKNIVIPGLVAVLKGALEEESGWEVTVGPREAAGIVKFAKEKLS